jgi:hypothetical protein
MIIREKNMILSNQSFPVTVAKYLDMIFNDDKNNERKSSSPLNSNNKEFELFDKEYGTKFLNIKY